MKITKKQIETLRKMNKSAVKMSNGAFILSRVGFNRPNQCNEADLSQMKPRKRKSKYANQDFGEFLESFYNHSVDESWWPKGRKRTQKWGVQQGAIIATLMKVRAAYYQLHETT